MFEVQLGDGQLLRTEFGALIRLGFSLELGSRGTGFGTDGSSY